MSLGVLFALGALIAWGIGDVLLQRSIRRIGIAETILILGVVAGLGLLPFIASELASIAYEPAQILLLTSFAMLVTTVAMFRAFETGKMAAVEPVRGLELPIAVGLSLVYMGESLSLTQLVTMVLIMFSIILIVTKEITHFHFKSRMLERGVLLAFLAACGGALVMVLVAVSSKQVSVLLMLWMLFTLGAIIMLPFLWYQGRLPKLYKRVKEHAGLLAVTAVIDISAWLLYALATQETSVSLSVAISEGYIALAAMLGVWFNRERMRRHQYLGITLATLSIVYLAHISG